MCVEGTLQYWIRIMGQGPSDHSATFKSLGLYMYQPPNAHYPKRHAMLQIIPHHTP